MELIDTIAPNLLEYNERLYEVFEIVLEDLMKEIEKNNILTRENAELLSEIKELSSETEELRGEINSLYGHVSVLEAQINELTSMLNSQPAPEDSEEPNSQEELGEPKSDINLPID